jgi:hypothetical protein
LLQQCLSARPRLGSFNGFLSLFLDLSAYLQRVGAREANDLLFPVVRLVAVVADWRLARGNPLVVARLQPLGKRAEL